MFVFSPTIALVLTSAGLLFVVCEFLRPGSVVPGVSGAVLLAFSIHSLWINPPHVRSEWILAFGLAALTFAGVSGLLTIALRARRNKRAAIF